MPNNEKHSDQLSLGFDRYQRFRAAADLINALAAGRSLDILDVGDFDAAFATFAPKHRIKPYSGLITPDTPLALPDASVDIVCALDVLEHVPPDQRPFFIAELSRAASFACVIAFPIRRAAEAERFVLQLTNSPWLAQHAEHGLPDPADIEDIFDELGLDFTRHPNACLPSWTAMMLLMYGLEPKLRDQVSGFFNRHYYQLENREPAYRYIYVCEKPGEI